MSAVNVAPGFCLICGGTVDEDIADHFAKQHQQVTQKVRTPVKSWEKRLDEVIRALNEIRDESDRDVQIHKLDNDVLKELYLVRARLAQMKRTKPKQTKEGTDHGSS
jgi:hypothetical protein